MVNGEPVLGEPAPFVAIAHRRPRRGLVAAFMAGVMVGAILAAIAILAAALLALAGT